MITASSSTGAKQRKYAISQGHIVMCRRTSGTTTVITTTSQPIHMRKTAEPNTTARGIAAKPSHVLSRSGLSRGKKVPGAAANR